MYLHKWIVKLRVWDIRFGTNSLRTQPPECEWSTVMMLTLTNMCSWQQWMHIDKSRGKYVPEKAVDHTIFWDKRTEFKWRKEYNLITQNVVIVFKNIAEMKTLESPEINWCLFSQEFSVQYMIVPLRMRINPAPKLIHIVFRAYCCCAWQKM